ncbi:MAG: response regulator [Clostridiales bacterium]|nr:response regulator [Clostridiales bacterium]
MIYYVEDDDNIRELVIYTLRQMGMPAKGFAEGSGFLSALEKELPDLVLLDVMLPGEDGLSLLRRLRADARTAALPVIMLTAKGAEFDKVQGLDLGADDYITKPFGMAELVARIRARLRRTAARPAEDLLTHGDLHIDKRAHRVFVCGEEKTLTLKEYELLLLLMENGGAAFTREQLLDRVWDMSYEGGTRTVDVHIQTLRAKLGPCGALIETVRGVGYRLGGGK